MIRKRNLNQILVVRFLFLFLVIGYSQLRSRASARNLAFALSKRMGNVNIFLTLSPDTACNYIIGINTNDINGDTINKINIPFNIPDVLKCDLPNRGDRK